MYCNATRIDYTVTLSTARGWVALPPEKIPNGELLLKVCVCVCVCTFLDYFRFFLPSTYFLSIFIIVILIFFVFFCPTTHPTLGARPSTSNIGKKVVLVSFFKSRSAFDTLKRSPCWIFARAREQNMRVLSTTVDRTRVHNPYSIFYRNNEFVNVVIRVYVCFLLRVDIIVFTCIL